MKTFQPHSKKNTDLNHFSTAVSSCDTQTAIYGINRPLEVVFTSFLAFLRLQFRFFATFCVLILKGHILKLEGTFSRFPSSLFYESAVTPAGCEPATF